MNVYIATIQYPYDDNESILGVYSSNEIAQKKIDEDIERYQKITNNNYRPMNDIKQYTLDV
jgi:hypothetical protein